MQFLINHIRSLDKQGFSWIPAPYDRRGRKIPSSSFVKMKEELEDVPDACVQYVVKQLDYLIKLNN